jgi:hypothetical protein
VLGAIGASRVQQPVRIEVGADNDERAADVRGSDVRGSDPDRHPGTG